MNWAVLQLRDGLHPSTPVAELEQEFRARWPRNTFHFPAIKQGRLDMDNPLSGYVFVEPPVDHSFERSSLVAAVLKDPTTRKPLYVSDDELRGMRPLPPFPPPGASVLVTAGDYSGLEGVVVEVNCATCKVLVELWSKKSVLTLAANELERV
jgi:hypothetical protein